MATPKPASSTATSGEAASAQSGASAPANQRPVQVKLVLLGEAAVGKSSLVTRFVQNDFHENAQPTIGAAFLTQKCRLEDRVIKFEIWDTAGQERFHSLAPMYYRNAAASIVVYDITNAKTLEKAKSWVKELQRQANPNIVIALVGNKLDLVSPTPSTSSAAEPATPTSADDEADDATATPAAPTAATDGDSTDARQVPKEEAQAYASENGLLFSETSAKTGDGIVELFTDIAKKIPIAEMLQTGARGARTAQGAQGRTEGTVNVGEQGAQGPKEGCAC